MTCSSNYAASYRVSILLLARRILQEYCATNFEMFGIGLLTSFDPGLKHLPAALQFSGNTVSNRDDFVQATLGFIPDLNSPCAGLSANCQNDYFWRFSEFLDSTEIYADVTT